MEATTMSSNKTANGSAEPGEQKPTERAIDGAEGKCQNRRMVKRNFLQFLRQLLRKRRAIAVQFVRPEFRRYAERAFQKPSSLPQSKPVKKKPLNQRIALCILKRSLRSTPLPRLPAFHCPKCGLTSRRLKVLKNHICSKRAQEYKNVTQTIALGFRSRVKDALAVLERIPRPQAAQVRRLPVESRVDSDMEWAAQTLHRFQPKTLCEIAWRAVLQLHGLKSGQTRRTLIQTKQQPTFPITMNNEDVNAALQNGDASTSEASTSTVNHPTIQFVPLQNTKGEGVQLEQQSEKMTPPPNGTAFYCRRCARLFAQYADWDEHLLDTDDEEAGGSCVGAEEPMEIQVNPSELLLARGRYFQAHQQPTLSRWQCTKCSEHFTDRSEFHGHLLECAAAGNVENGKGKHKLQKEQKMSPVFNETNEEGSATMNPENKNSQSPLPLPSINLWPGCSPCNSAADEPIKAAAVEAK